MDLAVQDLLEARKSPHAIVRPYRCKGSRWYRVSDQSTTRPLPKEVKRLTGS
jgi:hypothetical protein